MANTLSDNTIDTTTLPPALFRRWKHSREEDFEGVEVYRPEGFPFPVTHGRDGFDILSNGRFVQEDIGPADEPIRTNGHWTLVAPRRLAVSFAGATPPRAGFTFQILDLDDTVLRIHRVTRHAGPTADASAVEEAPLADFLAKPPPSAFRLIDFRKAVVLGVRTFPGKYVLEVSGVKPFANMEVSLVPLVYVQQPEFWEIEVIGSLPEITLPAQTPYTVSLPLAGTLGKCGIEVVGANQRQQFDLSCAS